MHLSTHTLTMHNCNGLNTGGMGVAAGTRVAAGAAATVRKDGPYVAPRARYPVARDECGRDKRSQQVRDNTDARRR